MNKKQIIILSMVAIVIFALGAYASAAEPVSLRIGDMEISFLPLVFTSRAADAPSGVLYVFSSTVTTDGNPGGRPGMGDICTAEDPDAHFCNVYEIENAFEKTGIHFNNPFMESWVDEPDLPGGGWSLSGIDCNGWVDNQQIGGPNGAVIKGYAISTGGLPCWQEVPVACCISP